MSEQQPNMPGHNHPPWPSQERQQKMCRRGDTVLCATLGYPPEGCPLCLAPLCAGCMPNLAAEHPEKFADRP